jgi:hypothetical protein
VRREQEITCNSAERNFRLQLNSLEGKGGPKTVDKNEPAAQKNSYLLLRTTGLE